MDSSLVGQKIRFLVGEPWNFHDFVGVESGIGKIISAIPFERDWIVFEWRFEWEKRIYKFGSARNRFEGDDKLIDKLLREQKVHCNMIVFEDGNALGNRLPFMTAEEINQININYESLTEKLGLIGSIQLASVNPPAWKR